MKIHYTSSKSIAWLVILASTAVASAQVAPIVNTSVGAVGGVTGGLNGGAAGSAGSAFGGAGMSAGSALDGGAGAVGRTGGASGRIDAFESIGMRQARLAEEAAANSAVAVDTPV